MTSDARDRVDFESANLLNVSYLWRRGWDSNPRALSDKTLSRRPRYDHFGTSPSQFTSIDNLQFGQNGSAIVNLAG
jgi:hypothetical protein